MLDAGEARLAADDAVLQKTSLSFDVSVWELFWPLLYGRGWWCCLGAHRDGAQIAERAKTGNCYALCAVIAAGVSLSWRAGPLCIVEARDLQRRSLE